MRSLIIAIAFAAGCGRPDVTSPSWNSDAWRSDASAPGASSRLRMLSAVESKLLPGMSRADVLSLLGPADAEIDGRLIYRLGVRPLGMDSQSLVIAFDGAGRLTSHHVEQS
jgi:hypothetical protein